MLDAYDIYGKHLKVGSILGKLKIYAINDYPDYITLELCKSEVKELYGFIWDLIDELNRSEAICRQKC